MLGTRLDQPEVPPRWEGAGRASDEASVSISKMGQSTVRPHVLFVFALRFMIFIGQGLGLQGGMSCALSPMGMGWLERE